VRDLKAPNVALELQVAYKSKSTENPNLIHYNSDQNHYKDGLQLTD